MRQVRTRSGAQFPEIIRGLWQASQGHQLRGWPEDATAHFPDALFRAVYLGFTAFDCADIYTGAEELLGQLRSILKEKKSAVLPRVHTKYVPDLDRLPRISFQYTQKIVDRSLKRLQVERLDLLQFHWWNYQDDYYLDALDHLCELRKQGKISSIGLTNFSSSHVERIAKQGFEVETVQLQASLLDKRCERKMGSVCRNLGIKRLGYGSLLGGFIGPKWLGRAAPQISELSNRSLVKYQLIIEDWGGWDRFQAFLRQIDEVAQSYRCSIQQVAVQALLQSNLIDAAIVGLPSTFSLAREEELISRPVLSHLDLEKLMAWSCPLRGDVYELERRPGKHSRIMRYTLNQ